MTESAMNRFDAWMELVDALLMSIIEMGSPDIPDECWYDYFEDGCTPEQALRGIYGGIDFDSIAARVL